MLQYLSLLTGLPVTSLFYPALCVSCGFFCFLGLPKSASAEVFEVIFLILYTYLTTFTVLMILFSTITIGKLLWIQLVTLCSPYEITQP